MRVGMIEDVVCRLLTTNREEIPYQRIVVIEEEDITELRALDFIEKRTVAVINARASLTGRKWHQGVKKLIANHIPVFDLVHRGDVKQIQQNRKVRVKNGALHIRRSGKWEMLGQIKYYDPERVERLIESAKQKEVSEKQRTVEQKLVHMGEAIRSMKFANEPTVDRPILIVERYANILRDLTIIKKYIRKLAPIIIAVNDIVPDLRKRSIKPDIVFGEVKLMDAITLYESVHENRTLHLAKEDTASLMEAEKRELSYRIHEGVGSSMSTALLYALQTTSGAVWTLTDRRVIDDSEMGLLFLMEEKRIHSLTSIASLLGAGLREDPLEWIKNRALMSGADGWY